MPSGRSEPGAFQCSQLSPYLHFGQISPVEIALAVRAAGTGEADDRGSYLEELIVRRELSMNFVNFNERYDRYDCLPDWAQATLRAHRDDRREHRYPHGSSERADTHDRYWNAAMREMVHTGYMHNYMRMYWAKKILEWIAGRPADAFRDHACTSTTSTSSTGATPIPTPTSPGPSACTTAPGPSGRSSARCAT